MTGELERNPEEESPLHLIRKDIFKLFEVADEFEDWFNGPPISYRDARQNDVGLESIPENSYTLFDILVVQRVDKPLTSKQIERLVIAKPASEEAFNDFIDQAYLSDEQRDIYDLKNDDKEIAKHAFEQFLDHPDEMKPVWLHIDLYDPTKLRGGEGTAHTELYAELFKPNFRQSNRDKFNIFAPHRTDKMIFTDEKGFETGKIKSTHLDQISLGDIDYENLNELIIDINAFMETALENEEHSQQALIGDFIGEREAYLNESEIDQDALDQEIEDLLRDS